MCGKIGYSPSPSFPPITGNCDFSRKYLILWVTFWAEHFPGCAWTLFGCSEKEKHKELFPSPCSLYLGACCKYHFWVLLSRESVAPVAQCPQLNREETEWWFPWLVMITIKCCTLPKGGAIGTFCLKRSWGGTAFLKYNVCLFSYWEDAAHHCLLTTVAIKHTLVPSKYCCCLILGQSSAYADCALWMRKLNTILFIGAV